MYQKYAMIWCVSLTGTDQPGKKSVSVNAGFKGRKYVKETVTMLVSRADIDVSLKEIKMMGMGYEGLKESTYRGS